MKTKESMFYTEPTPAGVSLLPTGELPGAGIVIDDEVALVAAGKTIRAAMQAHPELTGLLFVNPVMVLLDLGFELTPKMQRHVNRRLGQGAEVTQELEALEAELRAALPAKPKLTLTNPKHLAKIVFEVLKCKPRATEGVEVPIRPVADLVVYSGDPGPLVREPKVRTPRPVRPEARRHTRRTLVRRSTKLSFGRYPAGVRPIDFDAELPTLDFVDEAPAALTLEELIFYRPDHPLIPKLCRYQALHRRRLAFSTPEQYRKIRDGERGSMWRSWFQATHFPRRAKDT